MLVLGGLVLIPALLYCKVSLQSAGCVAELCRVFHNSHLQCSLSVRMLPYKQSADSEAAHRVWDQSDCVYRCLVSPMEQYNPPVLFSLQSFRMAGFPNESRAAFWSARQMEVFITLHLTSFSQQVPIHWSQPYVCPHSFHRRGSELHFHPFDGSRQLLFSPTPAC